jgi:hypothetical protein
MALFGKADEHLPYVTRFYQLELPPRDNLKLDDLFNSELMEFINHAFKSDDMLNYVSTMDVSHLVKDLLIFL